ncbi:MAG TPA: hypothetical protein VNC22_04835 [Sporichthya sp.]|nr:hypothetical protein [Sporichthya sp.]
MNSILDPPGGHSSAVYWRRRAVIFAALAVVLLVMMKACGGDGPHLSDTAVQQEVPLISTYTPTPTATSAGPTASSDAGIADDPNTPYAPGGTPANPCTDPSLAPGLADESGEPLCHGADAATTPPTYGPTATPTGKTGRATATPAPTRTATGTPKPTPAPTSDSAAAGPVKCAKSVLSVRLKTDRDTYTGSQKPKLYLGVKNSGPNACLVDLGSRALSFTVISGKDRIWSSDDCQGKGTSDIRLLKPGQTLWARSVWSKVRSAPGCPKGMDTAKPGYYRVEGSAGGVEPSRRAVFQLK